tara:strand:- start:1060 stop:1530 length:471 start_codon:yes stop_codon:yes gene_type:complete
MVIFKVTHKSNGKVYIGYSTNDNPNFYGSGKYIKKAIQHFGIDSFDKTLIESFEDDASIATVMERVDYWIKHFKADSSKYGYNESIVELIPKKKKLTRKLQVLLSSEHEDALNSIIISKSMEQGTKPMALSKYIRQLIIQHIVEETNIQKQFSQKN